MKRSSIKANLLVSSIASFLLADATAAPISWTGATDSIWNTGGGANWVGLVAPGAADIAVFDASSAANLGTTLGAPFSILGVEVSVPAGPVQIGGADLLTLGGSGIAMSLATQNLTVTAPVALSANQTWNVGENRELTLSGGLSRTAPVVLSKVGLGTVQLSGVMGVDQLLVGSGAVGGSMTISGATSAWTQAGTATSLGLAVGNGNGSGALAFTGGTHTFGGDGYFASARIGVSTAAGNVAQGEMTINGATVKIGNASALDASINLGVLVGNVGSASGTLTVSNGRLEVGRRILMAANGAVTAAVLNLNAGGTIQMMRTGSNGEGDLGMLRVGAGTVTMNFDGGTLIASAIHTDAGAAARTTINYNGTVLQANVATGAFITAPANATQRVKAGGFIFNTNGFDVTYGGALSNDVGVAGKITKNGLGTLTLSGANSTTGEVKVNTGTLAFAAAGTVGAGVSLIVESVGILRFNRSDTFGINAAPITQSIAVNGGKVTNGNFFNALGAVTLNGGSIESTGGLNANFPAFSLHGPIAITGTAPSTITGVGTNSHMLVGNSTADSQTTFNVADVTASSGTDLTVSTRFDNNKDALSAVIPTGIIKSGAGTMTLQAASTYTGLTTVNEGTFAFAGAGTVGAGASFLVGPNGTLRFDRHDTFGNHAAVVTQTFTVNGGLITNSNAFTVFGAMNLNGGTIQSTGGAVPDYPAFSLKGPITIGGTAPSLITGSGTHSQMLIGNITAGSQTTFDVADATGSPAADLVVSVPFQNNRDVGSGPIATGIIKAGAGTMTLAAANTYTGLTTVNAGTLLVDGGISGSATVNDGGRLGGNGAISGPIIVNTGGMLAPGADILNASTITLESGSIFELEINTTTPATFDQLLLSGNLTLAGTHDSILSVADLNPTATTSAIFPFITYNGAWNGGQFRVGGVAIDDYDAALNPNSTAFTVAGNVYQLDYDANDNTVALIAVPEPASAVCLLSGIGLVLGVRRRRGA